MSTPESVISTLTLASDGVSERDGESLAERAYHVLRAAIANLELHPSEPLSEAVLAQRYGFGRTPVREAVQRLRHDGLVVSQPRRGLFVSSFTAHDVQEMYELLEAIDGLAAYVAAERPNPAELRRLADANARAREALDRGDTRGWQDLNFEFHRILVQLGRNQRAEQYFDLLHDQLKRALLLTLPLRGNQYQAVSDHEVLVGAMLAGNPELARTLAQRHRRRVRGEILSALSSMPLPSV